MKQKRIVALVLIAGCFWGTTQADFSLGDLIKGMGTILPIEVTSEMLEAAVESSNSSHLKLLLTNKPLLKADEKKKLLKRAKELAQSSRRGTSFFKSPWDMGRFACGSLLYYYFKDGNIICDDKSLLVEKRQNVAEITKQLDPNYHSYSWENRHTLNKIRNANDDKLLLEVGDYLDIGIMLFGIYWMFR